MPPGRRTRVPPEDLPERSRIGSVRGAPEALEFVRSLAFDPPETAFDSAFATAE